MSTAEVSHDRTCRICGGDLDVFLDLGRQPLSDAFVTREGVDDEYFFDLVVARCLGCLMVQLVDEVPRERMFHADYPYRSSGSSVMRGHFEDVARRMLETELTGDDPFVVEIGSNDGVMLRTIAEAGVRHLGVDPSSGVAQSAEQAGVRILADFFEEARAKEIRQADGPADVIFAANTFCHIPYVDSVLAGVRELLSDTGVFVFEDPYIGDILEKGSFDQIYDEHFYFFGASSVTRMAQRHGLELVDVERLPVHGGEVRYTLAREGAREVSRAVEDLLAEEERRRMHTSEPYEAFAQHVHDLRVQLRKVLEDLRATGARVVGYGATAKSATINNFCDITTDLVSVVYDTTPEKQGRLTPGKHLPVEAMSGFREDHATHVLLYAWNHEAEIRANERAFEERGGKWITFFPEVRIS